MQTELDCVRAFHVKMGLAGPTNMPSTLAATLQVQADQLYHMAVIFEELRGEDIRFFRAHLLCEELAELLVAMANGDRIETLDALTDLCYVVLGTAVTFDLPLKSAFSEVHCSNMTKKASSVHRDDRDKGPNYKPPDLEQFFKTPEQKPPEYFSFPIAKLSAKGREAMLETFNKWNGVEDE